MGEPREIVIASRNKGKIAEILQIFHQMHGRGETIVIVTHDPRIAEQCQRIVRIVDGQIEADELNG